MLTTVGNKNDHFTGGWVEFIFTGDKVTIQRTDAHTLVSTDIHDVLAYGAVHGGPQAFEMPVIIVLDLVVVKELWNGYKTFRSESGSESPILFGPSDIESLSDADDYQWGPPTVETPMMKLLTQFKPAAHPSGVFHVDPEKLSLLTAPRLSRNAAERKATSLRIEEGSGQSIRLRYSDHTTILIATKTE